VGESILVQIVKVFSLVLVFGLSLVPLRGPAANRVKAPAPVPAPVKAVAATQPAVALKLDGQTSSSWTAIQKKLQAEYDAEQAKELADAAAVAAAQAAAAAPRGAVHPPSPPTPPVSAGYVQDLIRQAFAPQGQAAVAWGLRVAACESGYNPNAYNPGGPSGVFQFMPGTFRGTPYGSQNIFDAAANVNAAAWYYQQHGGGAWSCK
jgi:soluble lytic murein transglycosylase-like protein